MSTSSFDREIIISDFNSAKKLMDMQLSEKPRTSEYNNGKVVSDRERGEELLKQCLSRSRS